MIPEYYEFACPTKIVSGFKALSNLPYEMSLLGAARALVVTDQGVAGAGLIKRVHAVFEGADGVIGAVYDETPVDSGSEAVRAVADAYRGHECDCLVAVGGGSCIDTAKGALIVLAEDSADLKAYQGAERFNKPTCPFIVVPTTAGTGSEATLAAVIRDEATRTKMALTSYRLFPDVAILDPKMTVTMPPHITAATGMDALTHAVEAYCSLQKNPMSDAFSQAAIRLIMRHLIDCVRNGGDEQARLAMANAALFAGISFSNAMIGVVHALAHACGGVCRIPHGVANAVLLPWGMEYNAGKAGDALAALGPVLGADATVTGAIGAVRDLRARLGELCGLPETLGAAGVEAEQLDAIARVAIDDGSVTYNPEDVTYDDALGILKNAL